MKTKTNTNRFLRILGIFVAVLVLPFALFFGFWVASSLGSSQGSLELASEWRTLLSRFADPDTASTNNERIWVIRCDNGEWMFGLAQGSHGIWKRGGGTVVTKDSNGDIRSFRGHVCWSSGSPFRGCHTGNLATVYKEIRNLGFHALSAEPTDGSIGLQQAGTGQPATRPESKSEGSDKPQPDAEGRSR